jgi:hypothetical protein
MVRRQRALWLFGALVALTVANGLYVPWGADRDLPLANNTIRVTRDMTWRFAGEGVQIDLTSPGGPSLRFTNGRLDAWVARNIDDIQAILITTGIVLAAALAAGWVGRYVGQAALIRMVDVADGSEMRLKVRQGFRLGFSRTAWQLLLIDLVIHVPIAVILAVALAIAIAPLFVLATGSPAAAAIGALTTVVLLILFGLATIAITAMVSIVRPLVQRACAVDGLSVGLSLRQGVALAKASSGEVMLLWLTGIGIRLAWMFASIPAMVFVAPVAAAFLAVGILAGSLPAALVGGVLTAFYQGATPWVIGAIVGMPLVILAALAPLVFLGGLVEVFRSALWTLAYRELREPEAKPVASAANKGLKRLKPARAT